MVIAERLDLAARMLEVASQMGSSWAEMWGRLWRIDTLLEGGQLQRVQRELIDLEGCIRRTGGPFGRWHLLEVSATVALATARYAEAIRLAEEGFQLTANISIPTNFGGCAAILGQVGMQIGFDESGMTAHFDRLPAGLQPEVTDTSAPSISVFPALSVAMMALQRGDMAAAERAYALAGRPENWTPVVAMSLSCWAHGLLVAIGLGRTSDIAHLAEPLRAIPGNARRQRRRKRHLHGPGGNATGQGLGGAWSPGRSCRGSRGGAPTCASQRSEGLRRRGGG